MELVVEPWLEGVTSAIDKQVKLIKGMSSEKVKEMLTPVLIEEPEEKEEQKGQQVKQEKKNVQQ